ncbi:hypothetical protein SteCoe_2752 [Stentor coeruleus]|uniref:EF-hand domain-containing protein n=1 Tax=Stentor coeruleus TaxID=5963 RepID=A0A1R2CYR2_9CILI|nr:hypothetical protein SteCoe_2752 [Stentor coeruleus]
MGCVDSREETQSTSQSAESKKPEPQLIGEYLYSLTEKSLGFDKILSRELDNLFHRYSYASEISEENFKKVSIKLKIDLSTVAVFFDQFKEKSANGMKLAMYNTIKLSTLGILLGKCDEMEKARMLFRNYDPDTEQILRIETVIAMIRDILFVCLEAIPKYAVVLYPDDTKLKSQSNRLCSLQKSVSVHFVLIMLKKRQFITYEQFLQCFSDEEIRILLNPEVLRKHCVDIGFKLRRVECSTSASPITPESAQIKGSSIDKNFRRASTTL